MKKKIIALVLGASILGGGFTSCDMLEEDTKFVTLTETFFQTENELASAIPPIYNYIFKDNTRFGGLSGRGFSLNAGDPALTSLRGSNKQRILEFDDFEVSVNNPDIENFWKAMYRAIGAANTILMSQDLIDQIPMDKDTKQMYIAEVHFLRALAYYNVVSYFGKGAIVEKLMNGTEARQVKMATDQEVYDFILQDLEAAKILPEVRTVSRANLNAVRMLKAYVYMNMAGYPLNLGKEYYQKAADAAAEVINSGQNMLYDNFADLWKSEHRLDRNAEHIFCFLGSYNLGRDKGAYGGKGFRGAEEGGWKDYLVETEFYNNFPNDNRKAHTIYDVIKFNKKGKPLPESKWKPCLDGSEKHVWIGKYRDLGGSPFNDVTTNTIYPIFRYADALLILAEADNLANGGPTARAYSALREVQNRAYMGSAAEANIIADEADQATFDAAVLQERMWEFAFENKSWITMVRREKVKEYNKDHAKEDPTFTPESITEANYFFPIPEHETIINGNLK
ncbi:RagB/SusD family nutrient uptake outer membrane protein [Prolixibacteraceae bacterium]|nr:RagB/SusD family nutrient uptake outer membrane protein [Prolixibacteraceae bacterium]